MADTRILGGLKPEHLPEGIMYTVAEVRTAMAKYTLHDQPIPQHLNDAFERLQNPDVNCPLEPPVPPAGPGHVIPLPVPIQHPAQPTEKPHVDDTYANDVHEQKHIQKG